MTDQKTDNQDPTGKLLLREYFLKKYHANAPDVLDCCQATGYLWKKLKTKYSVRLYMGLDVKPKKGRLKLDSVRYLKAGKWKHDIIDIDTYGSPWDHYEQVLKYMGKEITVFLTIGQLTTGAVGRISKTGLSAMGLRNLYTTLPPAFHVKLKDKYINYCLGMCYKKSIMIIDAQEAVTYGNARYIGLRLEREKDDSNI